jgi:ferric-dicitrate binding protein FerR (iron transport regulator)
MLACAPAEGSQITARNMAKMLRADADATLRALAAASWLSAWTLLILMAIPAIAAENAPSEPEVGTTVLIKKHVTGTLGSVERNLETGFRVYRNELLRTGDNAQAELKLDDNTKLALGPDAELRLDEFVVASSNDAKTIAMKFIKGTFRFITGSNASESYKLETPSATIGVRGTVFDVYIAPSGDTFVLLHQGEVEICSHTRTCHRHKDEGRIVRATVQGAVSESLKWTAALVPGVNVTHAFPFVGHKLVIDPVRRLTHSAIFDRTLDPVTKGTGQGIQRALKKLTPF